MTSLHSRQRGVSLIEALVAILLFSLGVLGLIALQGRAVTLSADAKYRADAAFLADSLIGRIAVADQSNLDVFKTPAASGTITGDWVAEVVATLPNATTQTQTVAVNKAAREITVTLQWRSSPGADLRSHRVFTVLPPQ
ncbi:type IV pilus modification protein PilV [Crenobacter caeni]|uniref:Type IV pilus modification protein PilV n=1 Tax=Crenobacter caeni TaxID=2705474 RepID=A0A6B2KR77_9NEIS|nr:type IV pilus modification protein PilV [Crenobacter caeni]NDV12417.1 type IV pilus modification protein PilV [Crenobacter caeni]